MPKGVYDHAKPKGKQVSAQMWRKLEAEYLAGDCTRKDLSNKYGIVYNSILNYSRKNGWVVKKSEHGECVYKKAMEEFYNRSVQNMLRVDNIADKLLDKIERAVDELNWEGGKPFSCAWWAVDYDGCAYRILELYGCAETPNEELHWSNKKQFYEIARMEREHPVWQLMDTLFLGKDAYGILGPDGEGMEMIVKQRGKIGGPLEQFSTIDYKFCHGAKILYQERLLRVESGSSYGSIDEEN